MRIFPVWMTRRHASASWEGEEEHRVVNEVQGTSYIPMEMEK